MDVYKELNKAVYLFGDRPLAVLSENKNGCVALTFASKKYAEAFMSEHIESLASRDIDVENPELKPVKDSYEFMQLCAKHGYAGIELLSEEDQKSFIFCVRIEEAASTLPTALSFNKEGTSFVKTKFKEFKEDTYRSVKEWQRFDILDKVSRQFAVSQPFRNWENGDLYEVRPKIDELFSLFKVPCRQNYNSLDGSIPFFTELKYVFEFLNSREFISHLMVFSGFKSNFNELAIDISDQTDTFKIVKINNLKARLQEISLPVFGYVLNPNGPRDSTAYGTLSSIESDSKPKFYGISGTWNLLDNNRFEKFEERNFWDGTDTFYWNGINAYNLKQLDRSFSNEANSTNYSNLSEGDINDLIETVFYDKEFDDDEIMQSNLPENQGEKMESYCLFWWDAVTGEGKDDPIFFHSILDLITWLWQYECNRDFPIRRDGAQQCNGLIGVPATVDKELERNIHLKIKHQLSNIFKRIAIRGYKPDDGNDISGLVNSYYRTIHVDLIGFCKDILWRTFDDERNELAGFIELSEEYIEDVFSDNYTVFDKIGAKEGKRRLGDSAWNKLSNRAKYFISSSLSQLHLLGNSPQLDYSLVSIGFVKALEFELGLIFKDFCLENDLSNIANDQNDYVEQCLIDLSINKKGKLPALGSMGHLIKPNQREKTELRQMLGEYIDSLPCGSFMTSKKFWKEGIYKITNKYRNGGAHDSSISREVALECLDYIIGNEKNDGILKKLM